VPRGAGRAEGLPPLTGLSRWRSAPT